MSSIKPLENDDGFIKNEEEQDSKEMVSGGAAGGTTSFQSMLQDQLQLLVGKEGVPIDGKSVATRFLLNSLNRNSQPSNYKEAVVESNSNDTDTESESEDHYHSGRPIDYWKKDYGDIKWRCHWLDLQIRNLQYQSLVCDQSFHKIRKLKQRVLPSYISIEQQGSDLSQPDLPLLKQCFDQINKELSERVQPIIDSSETIDERSRSGETKSSLSKSNTPTALNLKNSSLRTAGMTVLRKPKKMVRRPSMRMRANDMKNEVDTHPLSTFHKGYFKYENGCKTFLPIPEPPQRKTAVFEDRRYRYFADDEEIDILSLKPGTRKEDKKKELEAKKKERERLEKEKREQKEADRKKKKEKEKQQKVKDKESKSKKSSSKSTKKDSKSSKTSKSKSPSINSKSSKKPTSTSKSSKKSSASAPLKSSISKSTTPAKKSKLNSSASTPLKSKSSAPNTPKLSKKSIVPLENFEFLPTSANQGPNQSSHYKQIVTPEWREVSSSSGSLGNQFNLTSPSPLLLSSINENLSTVIKQKQLPPLQSPSSTVEKLGKFKSILEESTDHEPMSNHGKDDMDMSDLDTDDEEIAKRHSIKELEERKKYHELVRTSAQLTMSAASRRKKEYVPQEFTTTIDEILPTYNFDPKADISLLGETWYGPVYRIDDSDYEDDIDDDDDEEDDIYDDGSEYENSEDEEDDSVDSEEEEDGDDEEADNEENEDESMEDEQESAESQVISDAESNATEFSEDNEFLPNTYKSNKSKQIRKRSNSNSSSKSPPIPPSPIKFNKQKSTTTTTPNNKSKNVIIPTSPNLLNSPRGGKSNPNPRSKSLPNFQIPTNNNNNNNNNNNDDLNHQNGKKRNLNRSFQEECDNDLVNNVPVENGWWNDMEYKWETAQSDNLNPVVLRFKRIKCEENTTPTDNSTNGIN